MFSTKWYVLVLSAVLWTASIQGAHILGLFPTPIPSHNSLGHKLLRELATRGHDVTMVSAFRNKKPMANYRDILLTEMKDLMAAVRNTDKMNLVDMGKLSPWNAAIVGSHIGSTISEMALKNNALQNILRSNETFDVVILEIFYSEVMFGVADRFNCPVLLLSTLGSSFWTNHLVGNPAPNSYVSNFHMKFSNPMSFAERLQNAVFNLIVNAHRNLIYFPRLDAQLHEYFPNAPPLAEIMYSRTALILLNAHPSVADASPHVPNMVQIGGFHIDEPNLLPQDLKDFMDTAKHGVILFSMGSNVKGTDLTNETVYIIVKAFAKLKQKVIWKWENETLPNKPENVKVMKWCPQNDIMAHPNLKLFITHGGLLSTMEAVYHGVPIIGIPIVGDQKMNVAACKNYGFCIGINYEDLSEDTFTAVLQEILNNPKYRNNAKNQSQIFRDQPMRPIDAAVYWTEYVIKYKGAEHLRSAAIDLDSYQLYSIDLAIFVIVINIVIFIIFYNTAKKLLKTNSQKGMKEADKKEK